MINILDLFLIYLFLLSIFFLGRPQPKLTWWLGNAMIDGEYIQRNDGVLVNRVVFPRLSRHHLNSEFVCQASNTNQALPPSAKVMVNLNCKYKQTKYSINWFCPVPFFFQKKEISAVGFALTELKKRNAWAPRNTRQDWPALVESTQLTNLEEMYTYMWHVLPSDKQQLLRKYWEKVHQKMLLAAQVQTEGNDQSHWHSEQCAPKSDKIVWSENEWVALSPLGKSNCHWLSQTEYILEGYHLLPFVFLLSWRKKIVDGFLKLKRKIHRKFQLHNFPLCVLLIYNPLPFTLELLWLGDSFSACPKISLF